MAPKADSKCSIAAKKKFNETMIAMGKAAGKAACTEAFEIWNTFIHTIAAFIEPFKVLAETILTIDIVIYNTFLKPPLNVAISTLQTMEDTIKKPAKMLEVSTECPDTRSWNNSLQAVSNFLTTDINGLQNMAGTANHYFINQQKLVDDFVAAFDFMDGLIITGTYDEWVASGYDLHVLFGSTP